MSTTNSATKVSGGTRSLNASQSSLTHVTRSSSMESLESSMSTTESNAGGKGFAC